MNDQLNNTVRTIARGNTSLAESFFVCPGGRRYLENICLILLNSLMPHSTEKEEMYEGFVEVLNQMESHIIRQWEGEEILEEALHNTEE